MNRAALVLATTVALFISVQTATAATRRTVNTGQTNQQIISGGATTGAVSTPNGYAAYYGQDHVDEHTAGSRYQAGQSVPTSGGTSSASTGTVKVKVKPVSLVNKSKVAAKAVSMMRSSPTALVALAAQEGLIWAIDQLPGASFDPQTGEPLNQPVINTNLVYYTHSMLGTTRFNSYYNACLNGRYSSGVLPAGMTLTTTGTSTNSRTCSFYSPNQTPNTVTWGTSAKIEQNCPLGFTGLTCNSVAPSPTPFSDSDYAALQAALAQVQNSE